MLKTIYFVLFDTVITIALSVSCFYTLRTHTKFELKYFKVYVYVEVIIFDEKIECLIFISFYRGNFKVSKTTLLLFVQYLEKKL